MELAFWSAVLVVAWAHVGYPLWALAVARARPRPWRTDPSLRPSLSILIAARDEAQVIAAKLRSVLDESWPEGRREVLVIDDGSSDGTAAVARGFADEGVRVLDAGRGVGKASALSLGARRARGDILVLTDARQPLVPGSLAALAAAFADPGVGAVSGELELPHDDRASGLGLYRRLDDAVRRAEALAGSSVGVTGALWAVRRALWTALPDGLVLDDVAAPLAVARTGARVVIAPTARVLDRASPDPTRELRRRARTLAGNLQMVRWWPWTLLEPHPLWFRFVSHKLSRLAAAPALLVVLIASSALAFADPAAGWIEIVALQIVGYGLAAVPPRVWSSARGRSGDAVSIARLAALSRSFTLLHVAGLIAWWRFTRGNEAGLWRGLGSPRPIGPESAS